MVFKRLLAAAVSAALVLSCAACGNQAEPENTTEPTTVYTPEENTTTAVAETTTAEDITAEVSTEESAEETTTLTEEISKAEIVAMYKAAAEKTHKGAKTYRAISLVDFSINNGQ